MLTKTPQLEYRSLSRVCTGRDSEAAHNELQDDDIGAEAAEPRAVLPQTNETDAQMSERGTLAVYSERLVTIGCQLVVCRHGGGGAPSARARAVPPPFELRAVGITTPLPREWGGHMSKLALSC